MPFFHCRVRVVVFNTTVNKISVILWQSVLLVEKTTDLPFHCRGEEGCGLIRGVYCTGRFSIEIS
jgi:hypothetical protein